MIVRRYLSRTGLLFGLLLSLVMASMATIQVEVNGQMLSFSVPPMQMNGRTMVPLRGIFESLGAQVNWNANSRMITATRDTDEVQLGIGNRQATVNGQVVNLDVPAMILRGSTMVPLRFVSEALGANVQWFEATQTVSITSGAVSTNSNINYNSNSNNSNYVPVQDYTVPTDQGRSSNEIYNLVAPIALYPDPLLAIILPAATYPDQVIDAENMNLGNNERAIDGQDWDISVKALAHYPSLLRKMGDDSDWTTALGQAYVDQPQDVMDAIQLLRAQARANGVLQTTREQRVYMDGSYVRIVPAQSNVIYVPQYDPDVVYVQRRNNTNQNLLVFGLGLLIGSWLSNDTDWSHHRVYNHGWSGSGWIANSRPHVTIDRIYTDNKDRPAVVNRDVTQRQVDRTKVRNYSLPNTLSLKPQTPSRPSTGVNNPRRVTPPSYTTPAVNPRRIPKVQPGTTTRQKTIIQPVPKKTITNRGQAIKAANQAKKAASKADKNAKTNKKDKKSTNGNNGNNGN